MKQDSSQEKTSEAGLARTAEHWGKEAGTWRIGRGLHWKEHLAVQERIYRKVSGDPRKDPYEFFFELLKRQGVGFPLSRCLTLGCGAGDLERGLSKYGFAERHDGYDIAEEAIRRARERAKAEGMAHIQYEVMDLNTVSLPAGTYDVVFGIESVHHVAKLEHVFSAVKKTLKPGGFFFLNEFVGPSKFQWTDRQLGVVNGLLDILPEAYRVSLRDGVSVKGHVRRPSVEEMDSIDPSEAVRSADIVPLLSRYFAVLEKKDLGGAVLHLLLQDIAGNFDYQTPGDMRVLRMLFEVEDILMEQGDLGSDFAVIIARKEGDLAGAQKKEGGLRRLFGRLRCQ